MARITSGCLIWISVHLQYALELFSRVTEPVGDCQADYPERVVDLVGTGLLQAAGSAAVIARMVDVVGDDPIPYGVESSRKTLETFVGFNVEQKVIPEAVDVEELFPEATLGLG